MFRKMNPNLNKEESNRLFKGENSLSTIHSLLSASRDFSAKDMMYTESVFFFHVYVECMITGLIKLLQEIILSHISCIPYNLQKQGT